MEQLLNFSQIKFFSLFGLISMIALLIPSLIFGKKEHKNRPEDLATCGAGVCMVELITRFITVILLIFIRMPRLSNGFVIAAGICMLIYYILWIRYFRGGCNYPDIYVKKFLGLPIPFAIFSVTYYILISLWLCNFYALIGSLLFGLCHLRNAKVAMDDLKEREEI